MSLTLIGTPIGNKDDITLRALNELKASEYIIGEELKTLRRRLSEWGVAFKEKSLLCLNEHTNEKELEELLELCRSESVSLVTDCGTPSFFDPGYALVDLCRKADIELKTLPGVSSLTALMPFLPSKTERFKVLGFPPQKDFERKDFFKNLKDEKWPIFLMDTPYRLQKTLFELEQNLPKSYIVLGINLTCEDELVVYGNATECIERVSHLKKENFVLMIYPRKL